MPTHEPLDPDFAPRVRGSFARQAFMRTIGAELTRVCAGEVHAESSAGARHVVTMLATSAVVAGRAERGPQDAPRGG